VIRSGTRSQCTYGGMTSIGKGDSYCCIVTNIKSEYNFNNNINTSIPKVHNVNITAAYEEQAVSRWITTGSWLLEKVAVLKVS